MAMKLSEIFERTAPPSYEEMRLIYDYIILPLVLNVVKHNQRGLDKKARSLRSVFVRTADLIISKIDADLTVTRRIMLNQNIVVNQIKSVNNCVTYQINCHGYEEHLTFSRENLLTEINTRISTYTSEIFLKK